MVKKDVIAKMLKTAPSRDDSADNGVGGDDGAPPPSPPLGTPADARTPGLLPPIMPPTPPPESTPATTPANNKKKMDQMVKNVADRIAKNKQANKNTIPEEVPKYLFMIYSPLVYTAAAKAERDEEAEKLVQSVWKPYSSQISAGTVASAEEVSSRPAPVVARATSDDTQQTQQTPQRRVREKRIKIRMASLITKMLNRLNTDGIIVCRERIIVTNTQSHVFVRVLTVERNVPILLMRCERIGLGTVVGACWVTHIDLAAVPPPLQLLTGVDEVGDGSLLSGGSGEQGGGVIVGGGATSRSRDGGSPLLQPRFSDDVGGGGPRGGDGSRKIRWTGSAEEDERDLELGEEAALTFGTLSMTDGDDSPPPRGGLNPNAPPNPPRGSPLLMSSDSAISIGSSAYDSELDDTFEDEDGGAGGGGVGLAGGSGDGGDASDRAGGGPNDSSMRKRDRTKQLLKEVVDARKSWVAIASRMRIAQVLDEVSAGARFGFDYICYVLIAAWIAGFGLATNSATMVIASMLVSPLMGPVMGFTFGTMVREKTLIWKSLRNECLSLVVCVCVGFIIGLIFVSDAFSSTYEDWPSVEMTSRGDPIGLLYGVLIALPSGMAVALSTLGKNSGGLTGVAISLSLLPPAVNAGLCWCTALLIETGIQPPSRLPEKPLGPFGCKKGYVWCRDFESCVRPFEAPKCPSFFNGTNSTLFDDLSDNITSPANRTDLLGRRRLGLRERNKGDTTDYAQVGTVSFLLTVINIACIWIGGCFMFWLKEVAPIKSKNTFWTHDVKAYRKAKAANDNDASVVRSWTKSEMEAIEKGINASFVLNDTAPPHTVGAESGASRRYSHSRRTPSIDTALRNDYYHAYASNGIEDALYANNNDPVYGWNSQENRNGVRNRHHSMPGHVEGTAQQHRTYAEALLAGKAKTRRDIYRIDEVDESGAERESLLKAANKIPGGLSEAGSVLFSHSLVAEEEQVDETPPNESFFTGAHLLTPFGAILGQRRSSKSA